MSEQSTTDSAQQSPDAGTRKVAELLSDERQAMFTTTAPDGTLMSRPMAIQATDFDGDLWFFAERGSRKVAHLAANPQVNVTVSSASTWVSLTGQGRLVADDAKKRELWNPFVEAWFPGGRDDDGIVLITVEAGSAEYWDTPGGRVATVLALAKAKLTGKQPSSGENEKVDLV